MGLKSSEMVNQESDSFNSWIKENVHIRESARVMYKAV